MESRGHADADERSLALHRLVAERLREKPALLEIARERVDTWLRDGTVSGHWARAWAEVLQRPLAEVVAVLSDPGERARDLRQSSPFAGVLSPRERWQALRRVRAGAGR